MSIDSSQLSVDEILRLATPRSRQYFPPTDEQRAVIEAPLEPLLVVAGAGAGKTTTMSQRVLYMVAHHGIEPERILGLTFTRKAAGELGLKMRQDLGVLASNLGRSFQGDPTALTYNSFAARILGEYGATIGVDPDSRLIGQAQQVQILTEIVQNWRGEYPEEDGRYKPTSSIVAAVLALSGHIAEQNMTLDQGAKALRAFSEELEEIAQSAGKGPTGSLKSMITVNANRILLLDMAQVFEDYKRSHGLIDFSDQLLLATRIVTENASVVRQVRSDYQAVLLDEFQDTSVIQMTFLSALFADHPTTAVGDPSQAIYGWRGASASALSNFLTAFSTPREAKQLTLSTAWRNDHAILQAANAVARPLRGLPRIGQDGSSGSASVKVPQVKPPVLGPRPQAGEGEVSASYPLTYQEELEHVVEFIRQHRVQDEKGKWNTCAVLCRRRADFPAIERALKDADIPVQVVGLGGLLDQPSVSDVRAALELASDPTNAPALMRLVTAMDIGAADLLVLNQYAKYRARQGTQAEQEHPDVFLMDAIDQLPPAGWHAPSGGPSFTAVAHERLSLLARRLEIIRQGTGRPLDEQIERAMSILGLREAIMSDPLGDGGMEMLDAFVDIAADYEAQVAGADLSGFLTWLAVAEEEEKGLPIPTSATRTDAVQLLTIHSAKGLEWDSVVVFGLQDSRFPNHSASPRDWKQDPPGAKEWFNSLSELPYPVRRDYSDLPQIVPEEYGEIGIAAYFDLLASEATSSRTTAMSIFNNHMQGKSGKETNKDSIHYRQGIHHECEERRLAYVAWTRARHDLLLSGSWFDSGSLKPRDPSRYLMETVDALDLDAQQIAARPDEDWESEQLIEVDTRLRQYPILPGRSRQLVIDSAARVQALIDQSEGDPDVIDASGDSLIHDTHLLLEEREKDLHSALDIRIDRVRATGISDLIGKAETWINNIRRPLPVEPQSSSVLGTIFHKWVEKELHLSTGELWDEPVEGSEALEASDQQLLAQMQENFHSLNLEQLEPIAIEEPFALTLAGISIQGRIDAVFKDANGTYTVIDWKTSHLPGKNTPLSTWEYYARQLQLYRIAWAQREGLSPNEVQARVCFLRGPISYSIDDIVTQTGVPVDQLESQLTQALSELQKKNPSSQ